MEPRRQNSHAVPTDAALPDPIPAAVGGGEEPKMNAHRTETQPQKPLVAGPTGQATILFKSCPRCAGDRSLENDHYGWYVLCLCCGHVTYPDIGPEPKAAHSNRPEKAEPAQVLSWPGAEAQEVSQLRAA